ncbi:MAG: AarF/UbiB family protein [Verrucomicrobiales bacterium]|nr:AarF/UbiB family protein [Verrucomicrobiales bacterium]
MSKSNALERLATYKDIAGLLLKYVPKLSGAHNEVASQFEVEEEIQPSENAEEFASDLENLGPTFIKVGQLLSTRADLLPKQWLAALQRLQDDVEPVAYEDIRERIESELGAKVSRLFEEFDETPLASASLGQVHRATLRNGRPVVVKVQRPDIRQRVAKELEAIQEVADFIQAHTDFGKAYDVELMVSQFRKAILGELNYQTEARNLERLRENMSEFRGIAVPSSIDDYCSVGVLTMDYIDGSKITELSGVVKADLNGDAIADHLFHAYLKQILIDGFFHADPHPGNILLTRDHRLGLIDLGMVGTVSDGLKDQLLQLLGAISEGRADDAADVALAMGTKKENFEAETFRMELTELIENRKESSVENIQVGDLVMKVTEVCGQNGLRIPNSMFMVGKALLNLDMIGTSLAPDFNPDESVKRHISTLANKRMNDDLSLGSVISYLTEMKELFSETPGRLNMALEKVAENKLEFDVNAIDEAKLLKGFHRVANRITVGIILAAMIVGASMMMSIEAEFTVFGYPGIAMIFFLIAAIGGLLVVGRILFGSEHE